MQIDVRQLLKETDRELLYDETWSADSLELDSELCRLDQPLEVSFVVRNESGTIRASGEYQGILTIYCNRCLEPIEDPLEGQFEARFLAPDEQLGSIEEEKETPIIGRREQGLIFLADVIRQDILLNCPMQFVCDEDCKGLCTECGANLNEKDCGHTQTVDPRWAKLEDISIEE